jgi:hypothetical protein
MLSNLKVILSVGKLEDVTADIRLVIGDPKLEGFPH